MAVFIQDHTGLDFWRRPQLQRPFVKALGYVDVLHGDCRYRFGLWEHGILQFGCVMSDSGAVSRNDPEYARF